MTWRYAALMKWIDGSPERYEVGLISAYRHGLGLVIPTGPTELGWAMSIEEEE